jgi:1-phosphatidylinositol-4-phosphate 5-kinase
MFLSADEKFIVKTLSASEVYKLLCTLPAYYNYLDKHHSQTLLTRYMSAHAIVMYDTTLYFVVMLNFFPNITLSERYDLKGSWVDRNGTLAGRSAFAV